jgi:hypothetical protein
VSRQFFITLIVTASVSAALLAPGATAAPQQGEPGVAGPSARGVAIDLRSVPDLPTADKPIQPREIPRRYPVDAATFGQLKARANQAANGADQGTAAERLPGPGPAPEFATIGYTGWNPPDAGLAVGPSSMVVAVNESFAVYSRGGALLRGPISFDSLFSTSDSLFDPRTLYDAARARFVLLASGSSYFALAVSLTSDPAGAWCAYRISVDPTGATWADFPTLGMDGDYLYITANRFGTIDNSFHNAQLQAVPKSAAYSSSCSAITPITFAPLPNPGGGNAFTVQPANQPDAVPGDGPMYLVNAIWSSGNNIVVRAVAHSGTGLSLSDPQWVASGFIAAYDLPANAPQPRGAAIATGDTRLGGTVSRYGKIYTSNTTMHVSGIPGATPNPYANAQWYEITPNTLTNSFGTSHAITSPSIAYFFPSVLPGCAASPCTTPSPVLEVSGSSRSQPASAFWVRGSGGRPTNYTPSAVAGYTLNSRWGDYSAVAADPTPTGPVWVLGEYARATNAWGTAVTSVSP